MIVHTFRGAIPADLATALRAFEERFSYPLGPGRTFRISHGDDYPRFFHAIGDASVLVAEREGRVLGCLAVALRELALPSGGQRHVAYLADLKIAPEARSGFILRRLMTTAADAARGVEAAVAVVMEGTRVTPDEYTGRVGAPAFRALGRVAVLRLPTAPGEWTELPPSGEGEAVFRGLSRGRYAAVAGRPELRSEYPPVWLIEPDGTACGLLEDTRRAKRLIADDGTEMLSAHLSSFAAATPEGGARLLRRALALAHARHYPALFVAVPEGNRESLLGALRPPEVSLAPAVVYGVGLPPGDWNINTAEI